MQGKFTAYRIHQLGKKIIARFEQIGMDDLSAGEVVIKSQYSESLTNSFTDNRKSAPLPRPMYDGKVQPLTAQDRGDQLR